MRPRPRTIKADLPPHAYEVSCRVRTGGSPAAFAASPRGHSARTVTVNLGPPLLPGVERDAHERAGLGVDP